MVLVERRREGVISLLLWWESRLIAICDCAVLHHLGIIEWHARGVAFLLLRHVHLLMLDLMLLLLHRLRLLINGTLLLIPLCGSRLQGGRRYARRSSNAGKSMREDALVAVLARAEGEVAARNVARDIQRGQVGSSFTSRRGRGRLRVDGS